MYFPRFHFSPRMREEHGEACLQATTNSTTASQDQHIPAEAFTVLSDYMETTLIPRPWKYYLSPAQKAFLTPFHILQIFIFTIFSNLLLHLLKFRMKRALLFLIMFLTEESLRYAVGPLIGYLSQGIGNYPAYVESHPHRCSTSLDHKCCLGHYLKSSTPYFSSTRINTTQEDGLRVLTFDGEADIRIGVLPELYSLLDIMRRVAQDRPDMTDSDNTTGSSNKIPEAIPCKCFDLIVGSGDGGWIAIMLGRMCMSTTQVIETYVEIRASIHNTYPYNGPAGNWQPELKASAFEGFLRLMTASRIEGGAQEKLQMENPPCYVLALAMHGENNAPHPALFRNYVARTDNLPNYYIWFAMRAVASSTIFPPARMSPTGQSFLASSQFNFNNPVNEAISEAINIAKILNIARTPLAYLVSLGAGHPGVESLNKGELAEAAVRLTQGAERAHEQALKRLIEVSNLSDETYFRVNVQQGFQKELLSGITKEAILTHTSSYLRRFEVDQSMEKIVSQITGSVTTVPN
ncbi:hypothetical protein DL96DRAFT_1636528 [Flagelloscypha sp. PMI_526]|nr:hypothetical protein DL96DRAFT_1636528 [Flagelloscypha sp. PMI_526]